MSFPTTVKQMNCSFTRLSRTLPSTFIRRFSSQTQSVDSSLHHYEMCNFPSLYSRKYKEPKYFTPMAYAILSHNASKVNALVSSGWQLKNELDSASTFGITYRKDVTICNFVKRLNSLHFSTAVPFVLENHFWNQIQHPMDQVYEIMRKSHLLSYEIEIDQKIRQGDFSSVRYLLINNLVNLTKAEKQLKLTEFVNPILRVGTTEKLDNWGRKSIFRQDYINRLTAISKMLQEDMSMPQCRNWEYLWDSWK